MQELNLAGTFRPWRMLLTTLPPTRMARKGLSQLFYKDIFYEAIYFISSCSFLLCKFPTVQIDMFQFSWFRCLLFNGFYCAIEIMEGFDDAKRNLNVKAIYDAIKLAATGQGGHRVFLDVFKLMNFRVENNK